MTKKEKIKRDAVRLMAMMGNVMENAELLDMMNTAVKNGENFDDEAEEIAVDVLIDILDTCEYILEV
jgi:hypothetical protein